MLPAVVVRPLVGVRGQAAVRADPDTVTVLLAPIDVADQTAVGAHADTAVLVLDGGLVVGSTTCGFVVDRHETGYPVPTEGKPAHPPRRWRG